VDLLSFGRAGARVGLASSRPDKKSAELSLLSKACQLSLHPEQESHDLDQLLTRLTPKLDPFGLPSPAISPGGRRPRTALS